MLVFLDDTTTIIATVLQVGDLIEEQARAEAWAADVSNKLAYTIGTGKCF